MRENVLLRRRSAKNTSLGPGPPIESSAGEREPASEYTLRYSVFFPTSFPPQIRHKAVLSIKFPFCPVKQSSPKCYNPDIFSDDSSSARVCTKSPFAPRKCVGSVAFRSANARCDRKQPFAERKATRKAHFRPHRCFIGASRLRPRPRTFISMSEVREGLRMAFR